MNNFSKADLFGLFTGTRSIDMISLVLGVKAIHPRFKTDLASRSKVVAWNLMNLFALCAFLFFVGPIIFWYVVGLLATWVAYRIALKLIQHSAVLNFNNSRFAG